MSPSMLLSVPPAVQVLAGLGGALAALTGARPTVPLLLLSAAAGVVDWITLLAVTARESRARR